MKKKKKKKSGNHRKEKGEKGMKQEETLDSYRSQVRGGRREKPEGFFCCGQTLDVEKKMSEENEREIPETKGVKGDMIPTRR